MRFDSNPTTGGSVDFLKLKDKESVTGVFRGDVHEFSGIWKDGKQTVVPDGTAGASFRFRINFVTKENNELVSKIWEQGVTVYNQLKDLHTEYNLLETIVKITRSGSGPSDTSYSILPIKKHEVTKEMEKQMSAVELKELAPDKPKPVNAMFGEDEPEEESLPF